MLMKAAQGKFLKFFAAQLWHFRLRIEIKAGHYFGLITVKKRTNCIFFSYIIDRWNEDGKYTAKILYRKLKKKKIFPERNLGNCAAQSQFLHHIRVSMSDLYIPTIGLPIDCSKIGGPILGINKLLTDVWKWKLGTRPRSLNSGNT